MKRLKYVIVAPISCETGGSIVLWALCKYLSEIGEEARVYCSHHLGSVDGFNKKICFEIGRAIRVLLMKVSKKFKSKHKIPDGLDCKLKYTSICGKNTVVIYPETRLGNILKSSKNVRWLLYHNRFYEQNGDQTIGYDKNDLFFCYREVFNDPELNPECRKLNISYFDFDTYKRTNYGHREGKCYIIRKGGGRPDLPEKFDGPIIDNFSEKEKVEWFNKCEYCISYDTQTTYSQIAAMCGCISIVVPEDGKTNKDYRGRDDSAYGVAFGFSEEEINYARETAHFVEENMKRKNEKNKEEVIKFVEICEKRFCDS